MSLRLLVLGWTKRTCIQTGVCECVCVGEVLSHPSKTSQKVNKRDEIMNLDLGTFSFRYLEGFSNQLLHS